MGAFSEYCPVCGVELKFKTEDDRPTNCAVCGANIANPGEVKKEMVDCDYQKSFLGLWPGTLVMTDKRLFWVKGGINPVPMSGGTLAGLAASAANNKNAGQTQVNVQLSDITRIEPARKGVRSGITVYARNGDIYKFYSRKLKGWIELLSQYISP